MFVNSAKMKEELMQLMPEEELPQDLGGKAVCKI